MTTTNDRAPFSYYVKLCALFLIHRWIQTEVTFRKCSIRVKIGIFVTCDLEIWRMTLKNDRAPFLCCYKLCASFHRYQWIQTRLTVWKRPIWVKINVFLSHLTLKNNRAPLLYYIKLCASFQSHGWIQTGVTVRKRTIKIKICNFLSHVILKFDGWPWKTIGHFFYVAPSFVHHFIAISEFKVELESGNAQFGSKSMIFFSSVTLKFDGWPWKTIGHLS